MSEINIDESDDYEKMENKYSYDVIQEGLALIGKNGIFKWCNKTFSDITGYTEGELKKKKYFDILLNKWNAGKNKLKNLLVKIIKQIRENSISEGFEIEYINRNNHKYILYFRVWFADKINSNLDVWVFVRDDTNKKIFEKELIASERKYHLLFDSANIAIIIVDGGTRKILDVNNETVEIFGYSKFELLKMKIESLSLEPFSTRDILQDVINLKVKKIPLRWYVKKDGNPLPVAITLGSYEWQGRKLICAIYRDLTDYLNENIMRVNLINKISQLHGDLSEFIKILNYVENPSVSFQNYGISEREQEIIKQIARGLSNKEIAKTINVSEITVKKHVSSIFQKLKIKKRTELIGFILNNKIKIIISG